VSHRASPGKSPEPPPQRWWTHAVGYEVYLRSFADSTGDGAGDLRGLSQRLDYLAWLGVDIVWITPFYPSPMHDHGYDVQDYTAVHSGFGTLDDFDAVVARAHKLGLRVIIDLVPNHTSSEHPWFRAARESKDNAFRDYYLWRDGGEAAGEPQGVVPPNNWVSVFGGRAWTFDERTAQWWLHLFLPEQPDLNWRNPDVREAFQAILTFWLERGVDGFRVDVAHALMKHVDLRDIPAATAVPDPYALSDAASEAEWERHEHVYDVDQADVLEIYQGWRAVAERYDALLLGEVYLHDPVRLARYLNAQDGLHSSFWFKPLHVHFSGQGVRAVLQDVLAQIPAHLSWVQGSHDRSRAATRFGGGDLGRARSLALGTLFMGLPGTPFLYMGEELGLEDVLVPPERSQDPIAVRHGAPERARDNCRTPMPWRPGAGLGFTTAPDAWLPFGDRQPTDTVEVQRADPASWLSRWRALIAVRHEAALCLDPFADPVRWIGADTDVVAYERGDLIVAANCSEKAQVLALPAGPWTWRYDSLIGQRDGVVEGSEVAREMPLAPLQAVIVTRDSRDTAVVRN